MTFFSNPKREYVLNPRGKALYDGKFSLFKLLVNWSLT